MKRVLAVVLVVLMLCSMAACSQANPAPASSAPASSAPASSAPASAAPETSSVIRDTSGARQLTRANGEVYPSRSVEIIIPLAAGGGADTFCRQIAEVLYKLTGQPFIVNNITGSSGMRGMGAAMNADPDGYTLVAFNPPSQPLSQMLTNPGFDMQELTPLCLYANDAVGLFVHPDLPYTTFDELLAAFASGELDTIGTTAPGSLDDITASLVIEQSGLNVKNRITYDGSGSLKAALLRKEVTVGFMPAGSHVNTVKDGDLRLIAILTADRFQTYPDTPAWVADLGYESVDCVAAQNRVICAPPGLDQDIADYLEEILIEACKDEGLNAWASEQNLPILGLGAADCRRVIDEAFKIPEMIDLESLKS